MRRWPLRPGPSAVAVEIGGGRRELIASAAYQDCDMPNANGNKGKSAFDVHCNKLVKQITGRSPFSLPRSCFSIDKGTYIRISSFRTGPCPRTLLLFFNSYLVCSSFPFVWQGVARAARSPATRSPSPVQHAERTEIHTVAASRQGALSAVSPRRVVHLPAGPSGC